MREKRTSGSVGGPGPPAPTAKLCTHAECPERAALETLRLPEQEPRSIPMYAMIGCHGRRSMATVPGKGGSDDVM
jgi:hypothetical protein